MSSSSGSPVGHPGMGRPGMDHNPKGMMGGPMVNRSNSVPANRSMLQRQLMDAGRCLFRRRILMIENNSG